MRRREVEVPLPWLAQCLETSVSRGREQMQVSPLCFAAVEMTQLWWGRVRTSRAHGWIGVHATPRHGFATNGAPGRSCHPIYSSMGYRGCGREQMQVSPLRFAPVEMTHLWWVRVRTSRVRMGWIGVHATPSMASPWMGHPGFVPPHL